MSDQAANYDAKISALRAALKALGREFDSVRIVATYRDPETAQGYQMASVGRAHYFAQYGATRKWLASQDDYAAGAEHAQAAADINDDGGGDWETEEI